MVELQPSKLVTWVRFPSPAPILKNTNKISGLMHFPSSENVLLLTPTANSFKTVWTSSKGVENVLTGSCPGFSLKVHRVMLKHEH